MSDASYSATELFVVFHRRIFGRFLGDFWSRYTHFENVVLEELTYALSSYEVMGRDVAWYHCGCDEHAGSTSKSKERCTEPR